MCLLSVLIAASLLTAAHAAPAAIESMAKKPPVPQHLPATITATTITTTTTVKGNGGTSQTPITVAAVEATSSSTTALKPNWTRRAAWQAAPTPRPTTLAPRGAAPVPFVIVHHTATDMCHSPAACRAAVRAMQRAHQVGRGWDDIGYNFLIGGNAEHAEIYEGRGFNVRGAHASGYNERSVGVALIGNWTADLPPHSMLDKLHELISYGQQMGYIEQQYTLLGHRQVKATECPGARLYAEIKQWPHYGQPRTGKKNNR